MLKSSLREQWQAEVGPAAAKLLQAAGTATQSISATFEDFLWAYSVFWCATQQDPATSSLPQCTLCHKGRPFQHIANVSASQSDTLEPRHTQAALAL